MPPAKRSGQSPDLFENLKVKNKCEPHSKKFKKEDIMEKMNRMMKILNISCGVYLQKWEYVWPKDPEFFAKSSDHRIWKILHPWLIGYLVVKGHKVQMSGKLLNKVWSTSFFWYIFSWNCFCYMIDLYLDFSKLL